MFSAMKEARGLNGVRRQLGAQLEQRRRELGKTRQDVEREGRIAAGTISRVEAGERLPAVETLMLLCTPLACHFDITAEGIQLLTGGTV
jgi:transcriptional regulator with XRE-family HTH domain